MALFDSYFDPQSYSGQGGLLGRLLSQVQAGGYDPSQASPGLGPNPMDANAAIPQPQASPIDIGGYSMPRIGSAASFNPPQIDPQTGNTIAPAPQAAPALQQPMAPAMPQQQAPQQPAQPSAMDGIGSHLMAGLQNFSHGGALIPAVVNGLTGLATGQRTDPQGIAQQNLRLQFQALIHAGIPQDKALLAVINPEFAKTIIPQAFGPQTVQPLANGYVWDPRQGKAVQAYEPDDKNKLVQIGENGIGGKQFGVFNPSDGSIKPYMAPGSDNSGALGDMNLTGKDYLASIPAQQRGTVQGMVEGTLAPPSSFALSKPYWVNMIAAAKQVDPTWDAANWNGRVTGMRSFKSGADAGTVRSANQVLGHISDLTDKADELHNSDYPSWNRVKNTWDSEIGADAPNNWVTQAHAVADEMSAFMKGAGHSSDTEIQQWKESLSPNMSPQQQRGAIKTLMGIYDHALQALEDKRTGAIGPVAAEKLGPLVTSAGQAAMDKVNKWTGGKANEAAAAPSTTKTGVSWKVVQ